MPRQFRADGGILVHVRLRPLWAYIDGIREFGAFFCETTFQKGALADRVRLVIHELLENAVKYSESEWSEVELSIQTVDDKFEISVSNYATNEAAERLMRELRLQQSEDAESSYQNVLARAAVGPEGESKLGLARIRYEGQVELSARRLEGGQILMTAKGTL